MLKWNHLQNNLLYFCSIFIEFIGETLANKRGGGGGLGERKGEVIKKKKMKHRCSSGMVISRGKRAKGGWKRAKRAQMVAERNLTLGEEHTTIYNDV